jgi:hypothetical protein
VLAALRDFGPANRRYGSMLLKKSGNTFWRFFRKKRSQTIFAD